MVQINGKPAKDVSISQASKGLNARTSQESLHFNEHLTLSTAKRQHERSLEMTTRGKAGPTPEMSSMQSL